ncbi:MAG: hypothetical protein U5N55_05620, partial [Cypionkella sp.]|nr:hypothetical protein [Cypionkella sp.]
QKDAGFVSADYNIKDKTRDYGASGEVALGTRTALTFSHLNATKGAATERTDSQIGIKQAIGEQVTLEAAVGIDKPR